MLRHNRLHYEVLLANFKDKPNIKRALQRFENLQGRDKELAWYLRHHEEKEINSNDEVYFRDDMDFLIGFYSVFMTAFLCGYVDFDSLKKIDDLDRQILNHPAVRRYYEFNYPLILPILLRLSLNDPGFCEQMAKIAEVSKINKREFETFLNLYRSRLEDQDINNMLFFLDDGYFYDVKLKREIGIDDFLFVLKNPDIYRAEISNNARSSILDQVILGYSKFMNYLHSYKEILDYVKNQPFQSAALWSLEFYWFVRLNDKIGDVFRASIVNLREAVDGHPPSGWENQPEEELMRKWQDESIAALEQGIQDIDTLKKIELGEPLIYIIRSLNFKIPFRF